MPSRLAMVLALADFDCVINSASCIIPFNLNSGIEIVLTRQVLNVIPKTSIRLPYCHFPTFIDKESMMICMAVMCIGIIDVLKLLFSSGGMTLVKSST